MKEKILRKAIAMFVALTMILSCVPYTGVKAAGEGTYIRVSAEETDIATTSEAIAGRGVTLEATLETDYDEMELLFTWITYDEKGKEEIVDSGNIYNVGNVITCDIYKSGEYICRVETSNGDGAKGEVKFKVDIDNNLKIKGEKEAYYNITVPYGEIFVLEADVSATDSQYFEYEWYDNNDELVSSLDFCDTEPVTGWQYYKLKVTDFYGNNAYAYYSVCPDINLEYQDKHIVQAGDNVTLKVTPSMPNAPADIVYDYFWYTNDSELGEEMGSVIEQTEGNSLTLKNVKKDTRVLCQVTAIDSSENWPIAEKQAVFLIDVNQEQEPGESVNDNNSNQTPPSSNSTNSDKNMVNEGNATRTEIPSTNTSVSVGGATYKIDTDSTVTYAKGNNKNSVSIPATIKVNGKTMKVTSVAANAFKNNKKLTSVVIGKNINSIGKKAFFGCKKLKKVTIKSKNLKTVGKAAFRKAGTKKLVVKVPAKMKKAYTKLLKKGNLKAVIR